MPLLSLTGGSLGLFNFQPLPDVEPFTIRSGAGYEEVLSTIRVWLRDQLVPYLTDNSPAATFQAAIDSLTDQVNTALSDQAVTVVTALNAAVQEVVTADIPITSALFETMGVHVAPAPLGGGQDDTAALLAVIAPVHAVGGTVYLRAGTYLCNLSFTPQFAQVKLIGAGMRATVLQAFDKTKPVVKFNGGSGGSDGGGLFECTLQSAANATYEGIALAYSGTTGVKAKNVKIQGSFAEGVRFWNERTGDFSEFNTFEGDISGCRAPVVYKVDNGVESFHGTGIEGNTLINIPDDNTGPVIDIRDNALPYNAPLSFTVWFHSASAYLVNYANPTVGRHCSFYGRIGVEGAPSAAYPIMGQNNNGQSNAYVLFAGTVTWLGDGTALLGNIRLCKKIGYNGATVWGDRHPYTNVATLKSGATLVADDFTGGTISICSVAITGSNYEYHTLLAVEKDPTNGANGYVIEFGKTQGFDAAGKGAPVFSYSNGLVITNNGYTTAFSAYVTVTPMGGGSAAAQIAQKQYT